MILHNNIKHVIKLEKKYEEYKEDVEIAISPVKHGFNKIANNDNLKESSLQIQILRNFNNNGWIFEVIMPKKIYDNYNFKFIELNNKKIKIINFETLTKNYRFRFSHYEDGHLINLKDLKTLKFQFYNHFRKYRYWGVGLIVDFNFKNNKPNLVNLNVREKNISFKFIESINLNIKQDSISKINPLKNNTAYVNYLTYKLQFNNLIQNEFLYKILEQDIEFYSENKYHKKSRNYIFDLFKTIRIEDSINNNLFNLKKITKNINPFKSKVEYYIDHNNLWNREKKEFTTTDNSNLKGYHLPLNHKGKLRFEFNINQNMFSDLKFFEYNEIIDNKLFDQKEGRIKLYTEIIKTEKEYEDLYYDEWKIKVL